MSAKMIAEEGSLAGLVVSLDTGTEWILGRGPKATILIADPLAGERHLRLFLMKEGIQAEPLDGNSVEVNDEEVLKSQLLNHGDVLKIGGNRFRFYREIGDTEQQDDQGDIPETPKMKPPQANPPQTSSPQATPPSPTEPVLEPKQPGIPPPQPIAKEPVKGEDVLEKSLVPPPSPPSPPSPPPDTIPPEISNDVEEKEPSSEEVLAHIDFGLDDSGPFLLKVIRGPNNGAEFPMEPGHSYVLGTDPQLCDVVFHDMSISRQHARITIAPDLTLSIEDLGSRNGTSVDEVKIAGKTPTSLGENVIVMLGTTSFIVFNRESERNTIITPFLPSIVRSLHDPDEKVAEEKEVTEKKDVPPPVVAATPVELDPEIVLPHKMSKTKKYVIAGLLTAFLIFFAMGTTTLFHSTKLVEAPARNITQDIEKLLKPYPNLQYSYNKDSKRLFLIGHVLTTGDRTQLMYSLGSLPFIRNVDDDNLVIDEDVLKETNRIINKPEWNGVTIRSVSPGRFVISGYIKKRKDYEKLKDFLAQNFRYLDRLDNRVVVEEIEVTNMRQLLEQAGLHNVTLQLNNGEIQLEGSISIDKSPALQGVIDKLKKQQGVDFVKNLVTINTEAPEQRFIDLTSTYNVTGSASVGGQNVSVFINGRILSPGDVLDGMTVTDIQRHAIFLEKDGVQYRIEYNK